MEKGSKNRQIALTVTFFKCQYPTQLLKILKIWFHIWIALEMYFRNDMDIFFSITTPSPLKMGAELGNISKIAWFSNYYPLNHSTVFGPTLCGPMNSVLSVSLSVCPSLRQWRKVLRIGLLVFSNFLHEVKGP